MVKQQENSSFSIKNVVNLGGKQRDKDIMLLKARKYTSDKEELYLLQQFFHLLVYTNYLPQKLYAFYVEGKTYQEVSDRYGIKKEYMRNYIYRNVKKIFHDLTGDPLYHIVQKQSNTSDKEKETDRLINRINGLIKTHETIRKDDLLDNLLIDFRKYAKEEYQNQKIDEIAYEQFIERMQYVSKPYLQRMFKLLDSEIFSYVVYLLTTTNRRLTERDKVKKEELIELWMLPTGEGRGINE